MAKKSTTRKPTTGKAAKSKTAKGKTSATSRQKRTQVGASPAYLLGQALAGAWRWARKHAQGKGRRVHVPGLGHDVAFAHALAFVAVLGLAIGAGYGGARVVFGPDAPVPARTVIQQTQSAANVILPDPDHTGQPSGGGVAYEEKVAEEIYVAPHADEPAPQETAAVTPQAPEVPTTAETALWRQNALDYTVTGGGPLIAIVIDDMGLDRTRSRRMWETVPGPLTLSFMTYAEDLDQQTRAARRAGHELMLHMPFEPSSEAVDPGPNVLKTGMAPGKIRELADWGMDRFDGFVGVNNHMGSRFSADREGMRVVLEAVQARGLLFLDSRTSPKSVARTVARELGFGVLERNVFLDNDNDVDKVLHQLEQVERLARNQGHAIAIGHPRDATIEVLQTWIPEARARGLEIVPISAMYQRHAVPAPRTAQPAAQPAAPLSPSG